MNSNPIQILVVRLSALGDVAMTVPVITSLQREYPNAKITVVSKPWVKPIFDKIGVSFIGPEIRKGRKGAIDFIRFFSMLRKTEKWDMVIDLHDVIFSKLLSHLFRLTGTPVFVIDKGRKDKHNLTVYPKMEFKQLASTFDRYADTFKRAGLPVKVEFSTIFPTKEPLPESVESIVGAKQGTWIGIAPFAQHKGKIYPIEKMEKVVEHYNQQGTTKLILFGGGTAEQKVLSAWEEKYENVVSLAGKIRLGQELLVMDYLDVMVSMDSANMHLASLCGTPVVSIWGATHVYAGFYGWNQSPSNIVQLDLDCRPCSVYGNKECMWGDYRCMYNIEPKSVIAKIDDTIIK